MATLGPHPALRSSLGSVLPDDGRASAQGTRRQPTLSLGAPPGESPGIAAVLDVLDALDRSGPATLSELARQTGVAKSTLHRVCMTMAARGWVARDPGSGQLTLGPRVAWLTRSAPAPASALTPAFHSVAAWLLARHNETTCLTVLDGPDSVFVAKQETSHPVRLLTAVGSRLPAFASASGRAMLADLPAAEIDALYVGCELRTPTGRRLDGLEELHAILAQTRRRGYGENVDETALGLYCMAAPLGPPGGVLAAITLCIPSGRINPARKGELVSDLLAAAARLVPGSNRPLQRKADR